MSLRTGSGKSVSTSGVTDNHSIVVVVAPLTVMQDQVVSFTERGLKCAYITGIRKL
jgi:superfamily II DNA helicase RecQ